MGVIARMIRRRPQRRERGSNPSCVATLPMVRKPSLRPILLTNEPRLGFVKEHGSKRQAMTSKTYRAFIGQGDDDGKFDYVKLDVGGLTWEAARDKLVEELSKALTDIEPWRSEAEAAIKRIQSVPEGDDIEDDFDGDDYVVVQDGPAKEREK